MKKLLAVVVACGAFVPALVGAEPAQSYWLCYPNSYTTYSPNGQPGSRCSGDYHSNIEYLVKRTYSPYNSYGLYVAGCYGCAGTEYYDGTEYFIKGYPCAAGYPGGHNNHSVTIGVEYTKGGSCGG